MKKIVLIVLGMFVMATYNYADLLLTGCDSLVTKELVTQGIHEESNPYTLTDEFTDANEGSGALKADIKFLTVPETWGTWADISMDFPYTVNMSNHAELVFWIKVVNPPATPENCYFEVSFYDHPEGEENQELWAYTDYDNLFGKAGTDWYEVRYPLNEFVIPQWFIDEGALNNQSFDLDAIKSISIGFGVTSSNPDSMVFLLDNIHVVSEPSEFYVFYDDEGPTGSIINKGWSSGTVIPQYDEDKAEGDYSLYFTGHDPYDGPTIQLANLVNLNELRENDDTLYFNMKLKNLITTPPTVNVVFLDDDSDGPLNDDYEYEIEIAVDSVSTASAVDNWTLVKIPLQDFPDSGAHWVSDELTVRGPSDFSRINGIKFTTAEGIQGGEEVLIDYIHAGIVIQDNEPPAMPLGLSVNTQFQYRNMITWSDVPDEDGEVYNIYYSETPISDIASEEVKLLATAILENIGTYIHRIDAPIYDLEKTFYYAVTCVDAAKNEGDASISGAVTNVARGVPAIQPPPEDFFLDGYVDEWLDLADSIYKPWIISLDDGTGFNTSETNLVTGDEDCRGEVWVAMDNENVYVAARVRDDSSVFEYENEQTWMNDAVEIYLGLYEEPGKKHTAYQRGVEPDYQIRFTGNVDAWYYTGSVSGHMPLAQAAFDEAVEFKGYVMEAQFPLAALTNLDENAADSLFTPDKNMMIPFSITILDSPTEDQAFDKGLTLSSHPDAGNSWQSPSVWTHAYLLKDRFTVDVSENKRDITKKTTLFPNYPNPFNPKTVIEFYLDKKQKVSLEIFNLLGQAVLKPINNKNMSPGNHKIHLDMKDKRSGVYFYRLKTEKKSITEKMLLLK